MSQLVQVTVSDDTLYGNLMSLGDVHHSMCNMSMYSFLQWNPLNLHGKCAENRANYQSM